MKGNEDLDFELRQMIGIGMPSASDEQGAPFCFLHPKSGASPALTLEKVSDGGHKLADPTVALYPGGVDQLTRMLDLARPPRDELRLESAADLHMVPIMPRSVRRGGSRTASVLDGSTADVLMRVAARMPAGPAAAFALDMAERARQGGLQ